MPRVVWDSGFEPGVARAVSRALEDVGEAIRDQAKSNTSHGSIARSITSSKAQIDASGPFVTVRYARGLGPIFEKGTKQRFTRSGAARGLIQPGEFALSRARDTVLSRGLDLSRYL